jgi:hypothetical protein
MSFLHAIGNASKTYVRLKYRGTGTRENLEYAESQRASYCIPPKEDAMEAWERDFYQ